MVNILAKRLKLRDFNQDDWTSVHRYASDPEVTRHVGWGPNCEEDTKNFIRRALTNQLEKPRRIFELAVILKEDDTLIGACRISVADPQVRQGSIGYVFNRSYWGKGYATEASAALLAFGFKKLGLHRIYATCDIDNTASAHVLEKIGMQRERRLREYRLQGKYWRDLFMYTILDNEWSHTKINDMQQIKVKE